MSHRIVEIILHAVQSIAVLEFFGRFCSREIAEVVLDVDFVSYMYANLIPPHRNV